MWLSVTLAADADHADALSDALLDQGAITVSVEDALAGTPDETPQFGEPGVAEDDFPQLWSHSRVIALFERGDAPDDLGRRVAAACAAVGVGTPATLEVGEVAEQNWVQLTQSQFEPIRINDRLWIVPSWHTAPEPSAINLLLDPGMAFGTGSHPTTRLCLEWLCEHVRAGDSVLDYGCGSGILGIAAARLGARRALGVDIDHNALTAAQSNAAANRVVLELRHSHSALDETFDLVVANILTNPLCVLAPLLGAKISAGSRDGIADRQLALSGVLEKQADEVIAAYAPFVALKVAAALDGWVLLDGPHGWTAA